MICKICNKPIRSKSLVTVLSRRIYTTSDNGDYNFFPDFIENQEVVHDICFDRTLKPSNDEKFKELLGTLRSLGEKAHKDNIYRFYKDNHTMGINEMITSWFMNLDE
jgi:hypothetical protein